MPRCVGCWLQCPETLEISRDNTTPALDLGTTEAVAGSKNQVGEVVTVREFFTKLPWFFQDFMCSQWNIPVRVSKFEAVYLKRQFAEVSRIGFLRWFLEVC